jgi:hypothetical protein
VTGKDEDELDLYEARKALADAQFAETQVGAVVGAAARNSREVRTIVEKNGYVERFRELLRGA